MAKTNESWMRPGIIGWVRLTIGVAAVEIVSISGSIATVKRGGKTWDESVSRVCRLWDEANAMEAIDPKEPANGDH